MIKLYSPLHHYHELAGARFLEWGGWRLPATYKSPLRDELHQVRTHAGYTEFPFLSHILVRGPDALNTLQNLCSRNLEFCAPGRAVYTLVLNKEGAIIDNGIIFRLAFDVFVISVPSRNTLFLPSIPSFIELKEPKEWLQPTDGAQVCIYEIGAFHISVQGPQSRDFLKPIADLRDLSFFSVREVKVGNVPTIVARTGFSGELGFEFLVWPEYAPMLWEMLEELGEVRGIGPYGIEATNVLGVEKGYLNAVDFYDGSTPLELGLGWAVSLEKPDFVGRQAVLRRREEGLQSKLVGLELAADVPVPMSGDPVSVDGNIVGKVTNAAFSPTLSKNLARASLPITKAAPGTQVEVLTNGTLSPANVHNGLCWYDPRGLRLRL